MNDEPNGSGRPPIIATPEDFQAKVEEYVAQCEVEERPMTVAGICYFLGFASRQSFYDYENRDGFSYIVKKTRLLLERAHEESLHKGGGQVAGPIFWMKNNAGYRDRTDVALEGGDRPIALRIIEEIVGVDGTDD